MRPAEVDIDRIRNTLDEAEFRGFCLGLATWNDLQVDELTKREVPATDERLAQHAEDARFWVDFALHVNYPSQYDDPRVRRGRREDG